MKTLALATVATLMLLTPAMAQTTAAPTTAECDAWLAKADVNGDGTIGSNEDAKKYSDMITKGSASTGTGEDVTVTKEQFLTECAKGTFGMPTP